MKICMGQFLNLKETKIPEYRNRAKFNRDRDREIFIRRDRGL